MVLVVLDHRVPDQTSLVRLDVSVTVETEVNREVQKEVVVTTLEVRESSLPHVSVQLGCSCPDHHVLDHALLVSFREVFKCRGEVLCCLNFSRREDF